MVKDLVEVSLIRQTKEEVLIQDLLSGPVVGYSYDQDGPKENECKETLADCASTNTDVGKDEIDIGILAQLPKGKKYVNFSKLSFSAHSSEQGASVPVVAGTVETNATKKGVGSYSIAAKVCFVSEF